MGKQRYIYVVFSSTPCIMGGLIRFATGHEYNHVSLALDPKLYTLYSFARRYKNLPLYGGFVRESSLRYRNGDRRARIRVYRLPVNGTQLSRLHAYLDRMKEAPEQYLYNTISAAGNLFHRRVVIPNAYTCIEFITEALRACRFPVELEAGAFYSLPDLEKKLDPFFFYEGWMPSTPVACSGDAYSLLQPPLSGAYLTLKANAALAGRFFRARHIF